MQKQFVTYETALKLKELGFDEPCFALFDHNSEELYFEHNEEIKAPFDYSENSLKGTSYIIAPLYQQVIDWFREEYNIVIEIVRQKYFDTYEDSYAYQVICKVYKNKELDGTVVIRDNKNNYIFYSYPEAREQAILKVIEIINQNNNGTN